MASSSRRKSNSSGSDPFFSQSHGFPQDGGYTVRTIGDIRHERERGYGNGHAPAARTNRKGGLKAPLIILGTAVVLALIAMGIYIFAMNSDALDISEVEFEGVEHLTEDEVSALVSIPQGTTLLNVDTASIAESLKRDAWVKDVDVTMAFPDRMVIHVTEREIGAVAEVPMGTSQSVQDWAISDDGIWLMAIPSRSSEIGSRISENIYKDAEKALHITGIPYGVEPQIGYKCTDESIVNALEIVTGLTTELAEKVKTVTATDTESALLTLDDNVEIAFGNNSNIREKERICLQIMEEHPKVVYINVRVPDRPTWRSL